KSSPAQKRKENCAVKSLPAQTFVQRARPPALVYNRASVMLRYRPITFVTLVTLAAAAAFASACGSRISGHAAASAQARRLPLRGVVVASDGDRITVSHDAIPGYMEAMTMSFAVRDRDAAAQAEAGAPIAATLVVEGERSWLDDVSVASRPT